MPPDDTTLVLSGDTGAGMGSANLADHEACPRLSYAPDADAYGG